MNPFGLIALIAFSLVIYYGVFVIAAGNSYNTFRDALREGVIAATGLLLAMAVLMAIIFGFAFLALWTFG